EFATNGKDAVTVEHVLTHTAGFPFAPLKFPAMLDRQSRLEAFARWRLDWPPGSRLQFHLTSAAWLIAELIDRRTGSPFADYLRRETGDPLGPGLILPLPAEQYDVVLAAPVAIDRTSVRIGCRCRVAAPGALPLGPLGREDGRRRDPRAPIGSSGGRADLWR